MRRDGVIKSIGLLLAVSGCALPGTGDGGGTTDGDDGDTEDSGSSGPVLIGGAGSGGLPPRSPFGAGAGASTGSAGSTGTAGNTGMPDPNAPRVSAWAGFTLVPGLGATCTIASADDPAAEYGSLATKPCVDGSSGCAELAWSGLTPAPNEIGADPYWTVDAVLDDQGTTSHLIVMRRYGRGTQGSETIVYEAASGAAIAGFRNGEPSPLAFLPALQSNCSLAVVGAAGRLWMVVSDAGVTRVATAELAELGGELELTDIAVDGTVVDGTMLGGPDFLALEADDGLLHLVTPELGLTSTYGPDVRVWLSALAGERVLVRSEGRDGLYDSYYLMDAEGTFAPLLTDVDAAGSDGASLVWIDRGTEGSDLHVAAASEDGFDVVGAATVPVTRGNLDTVSVRVDLSPVDELRMAEGRFVVIGSNAATFSYSAFILGADGRQLAEVPIGSTPSATSPVLALQGSYLWIGVGYDDAGAFPTLHRIEY